MALKTDYKNAILDTSKNTKRKYNMTNNADGTVSFDDATTYSQVGDRFGATELNAINTQVNKMGTIISKTLSAKATSLTFTDASITTDSIIEPYQQIGTSATSIIAPLTILVDNGSCTMTFDAQDSDVVVGIRVI